MGMPKQRREPDPENANRRDEIADALRARIAAGELVPGALVPSVREVADEYGCARMTAQSALQILAGEGVITTRHRRGSIVAVREPSVSGPLERLGRSVRGAGLFRPSEVPEMLAARLETGHPEAITAFGLERDAVIGLREYAVRDRSGVAMTYGMSWFPPDVWSEVPELGIAEPIVDGAIGAIRRVYGIGVTVPRPWYSADEAREAEAAVLGIPEGSPVLLEVTQVLAPSGEVVEYAIWVHRARMWVGQ